MDPSPLLFRPGLLRVVWLVVCQQGRPTSHTDLRDQVLEYHAKQGQKTGWENLDGEVLKTEKRKLLQRVGYAARELERIGVLKTIQVKGHNGLKYKYSKPDFEALAEVMAAKHEIQEIHLSR